MILKKNMVFWLISAILLIFTNYPKAMEKSCWPSLGLKNTVWYDRHFHVYIYAAKIPFSESLAINFTNIF